jgi:hypothetical protein
MPAVRLILTILFRTVLAVLLLVAVAVAVLRVRNWRARARTISRPRRRVGRWHTSTRPAGGSRW